MTFLKNIAKAVLPSPLLSGLPLFLSAREILNPYSVQNFQLAYVVAISALGLNLIYGFAVCSPPGTRRLLYGWGRTRAALLTKLYVGAIRDEALCSATGACSSVPYLTKVRRGAPRVLSSASPPSG